MTALPELAGSVVEGSAMQRAKAFFYVSLGILALAGAFHLGANTAQGQGAGVAAVAFGGSNGWALASNGDFYQNNSSDGSVWLLRGNIFGSPVQATETTWGRIKADRR